jgi:hypothetical protein
MVRLSTFWHKLLQTNNQISRQTNTQTNLGLGLLITVNPYLIFPYLILSRTALAYATTSYCISAFLSLLLLPWESQGNFFWFLIVQLSFAEVKCSDGQCELPRKVWQPWHLFPRLTIAFLSPRVRGATNRVWKKDRLSRFGRRATWLGHRLSDINRYKRMTK